MITVSAPGKVHLLGEHSVVYGKPAILTTVDLRTRVILNKVKDLSRMRVPNESGDSSLIAQNDNLKKIIEPIIKKYLKLKSIPPYSLKIDSHIPIGSGLGSSAAVSAAYIAALLSFLKINWDLNLINKLTYEAEKIFHGNPSGADPATVIYGGLIWFRKEDPELKIIHPLPFSIPIKLANNFVLIQTGTPKQTTKDMVEIVSRKYKVESIKYKRIFDIQERLVKELLPALKNSDEKELIRIIREGEKNLESIGVCSPEVSSIIRNIENAGGAAKICGAGASVGPTGVLLCYHKNPEVIKNIAKSNNLEYFQANLGVEGLRQE